MNCVKVMKKQKIDSKLLEKMVLGTGDIVKGGLKYGSVDTSCP